MARRATYFNKIWDENLPLLVLDGGDLFGDRNRRAQIQGEFLAKQTASFGYDAIGLGERDLNYGFEFLQQMIAEYDLPFTNANVRNAATGELLLPEYLVIERGGVRFGICSVLGPAHRITTMAARDVEYEVADPVTVLQQLVPRLRELSDCVVLLSHFGEQPTETVLEQVPTVDIVVLGHALRSFDRPRTVHRAFVLAAVPEGQRIGRADLGIDLQTGQVMTAQIALTALDEAFEHDPVMLAEVDAFKQRVDDLRDAQRAAFPRDQGSPAEQFLGDNNCKACHTEIHRQWRKTSHSRAHLSLRGRNMQSEPECLVCHTTGYRHYNGFDEHERANLSNVQCEACHGYGTQHDRTGEMLKVARESCTRCHVDSERPCHDEHKDEAFDYARFWERIAH